MSASNERKLGAGAQLLTVTDFLSEVELLRKEGNRRLLVLSTENLGPGSVTMRVQTPGGNAWFDLPVAAVTGVSPVISGYNNDPSLMMAEVAMRPEFEALFSNIASMAKIPIGAWGYSGAHVVPRNYYERHSIRSARVLQPEPCPITSDDFLGEPGSFTNVGVAPPPRSSYVRVAFFNQEIGSHRALLRQGGRVVARFYGDLSDERLKSAFTSDGNDVQFEFQRCDEFDDGSHRWVPLTNFVTEKASGPD